MRSRCWALIAAVASFACGSEAVVGLDARDDEERDASIAADARPVQDAGFRDAGFRDASSPPDAGPRLPTFTNVYGVMRNRCSCHTVGGVPPLSGTKTSAYNNLVNRASSGPCANEIRVIPNDAQNSVLYRKIANVDLCGERMPRGGPMLPAGDIALIRDWIDQGAAND
jgi:hypothetical protein